MLNVRLTRSWAAHENFVVLRVRKMKSIHGPYIPISTLTLRRQSLMSVT